jgi:ribonucleoside-diphosphate reductase alpha chain
MGGVSQGQEPIFANTYIHESPAGDIRRASPWLVDLLKSKGKWDKEVLDSIVDTEGSLAHLDFLTDEEKALGKTAYEQDQYAIIRMAEDRARYIDQGQSVNLYFNALAAEKEIGDIHRYAMTECNDLKALYYIRSMSLENSKIKHEPDCASCAS